MRRILLASRAHLESVGESWAEHRRFAAGVGWRLVKAGTACLIHSLVPALFPTTASRTVRALQAQFEGRGVVASAQREPFAPLLLLSLATAAMPWAGGAHPLLAWPLTLLSLGFPIAFVVAARDGHVSA